MHLIPSVLIKEFMAKCVTNLSSKDGQLVETLAYLVGHFDDGNLIGTHLIFPKQHGEPFRVTDESKLFKSSIQ